MSSRISLVSVSSSAISAIPPFGSSRLVRSSSVGHLLSSAAMVSAPLHAWIKALARREGFLLGRGRVVALLVQRDDVALAGELRGQRFEELDRGRANRAGVDELRFLGTERAGQEIGHGLAAAFGVGAELLAVLGKFLLRVLELAQLVG